MKITITASSPSIDSSVDPRFGRAAYFIVVDTDTLAWQAHANPAVGAAGGAGSQAAQFVAQQHINTVISGDFGPNAYNALQAAGIAMHLLGASTTAKEATERFKAGLLERASASRGPRHHSRG
jgi:predicted Fe-Mo cluster-binding NifX family protein